MQLVLSPASISITKKIIPRNTDMKITAEILENKVEQLEVALDGLLDRMSAFEARLKDVTEGSALFVDADRALVSSRPADLDFIRREIRKGSKRFQERTV